MKNQVTKRTRKLMKRLGLALIASILALTLTLTWDHPENGPDNPSTRLPGQDPEI